MEIDDFNVKSKYWWNKGQGKCAIIILKKGLADLIRTRIRVVIHTNALLYVKNEWRREWKNKKILIVCIDTLHFSFVLCSLVHAQKQCVIIKQSVNALE